MRLNYLVHKETKDIYKALIVDNKVTGYIKYKHVNYKTDRKNQYGYYKPFHYPFESYKYFENSNNSYFEKFGSFLPNYRLEDFIEINQFSTLKRRITKDKKTFQIQLIKEMLEDFSKLPHYNIKHFGLDASLQCSLETPSSDIDMVVNNPDLYRELYEFILEGNPKYNQFKHNLVERRGSYSSFVTSKELLNFESRKISYVYKNVKVSILFVEEIDLLENLTPTSNLAFIEAPIKQNSEFGEPSIQILSDYKVIYGPNMDNKPLTYLSVIPVRTGFIAEKGDKLLITGMIYRGILSGNYYLTQFIWDYCKVFEKHNIALNTFIRVDRDDKTIIKHLYENLKL